ncbi:DUF7619 domain-containing protein [Pontibacter chinhatensis]|uniref:Por secretion system C-terminal sorting domain-containing protein n=1 Tax=Pontibacter chinhatensis TaxID=1436961 RepID=A0A1I2NIC6_9BACT|nr:IPT/TIG domain-containing protein [Pontibacter chinhatensis]SFG01196.1 Por secretion system C-terminal sorting domain-containing protein [Pontibacter chinhatensis]
MRTTLLALIFLCISVSAALAQDYKLGYVIGNTVSFPYDITVGPDNKLYLADDYSTRVFSLSGTMLDEYHLTGRYHDSNSHMATSLDSEGNMYTISFGSRIQKISPDNEILLSFGEEGSLPGQLNDPKALVVTKDGTIIIADTENHRIQKFDQQGNLLSVIGSFGELPGQFNLPNSLALDKEENLYVTDPYNARIQIFDKTGKLLTYFGSGWAIYPDDIALDAEGYVYITELSSHQVIKFDTTGYWHMNFGSEGTGNGQFTGSSMSLTLDAEGNIYVADRGNDSRVQKFSPEGEFLLDFGNFRSRSADKLYPYAIKSDQVGNYYVAFSNGIIQKYDTEGNLLFAFGGKGTDNGKFTSQITSMEIDQAGNLYVLSKETAGSVQKFTPNGVFISRFAPASSTGTASPTALANPIYLKLDPQGNTYVSDDIYLYQFSPDGKLVKRQSYVNNETGAPISFKEGVFNSRLKFSIDKEGVLYILLVRKSKKFTLNGEFLGDFVPPNAYPDGFTAYDMDFDGQNNMYLSNWGHIYKYDAHTKALVGSSRNYSYIFHILQNSFSVNKLGSRILVLSPNNTVASFTNNKPITLPDTNNITGTVYHDKNNNCTFDENDSPLSGILVEATPGPYYSFSDNNGNYSLPVGSGAYQVKQILPAKEATKKIVACQDEAVQVTFSSLGQTQTLHHGNQVTLSPHLSVSVSSDRRRRCFESTTTVRYLNSGFATAPDAKVYLQLPSEVELLSADKAYIRLSDGTYEFAVGDLAAGQQGTITITDIVTCGDESVRGRTVCTRAWITPSNNAPAQPTPTVTITGRCDSQTGMIRFVIRNSGKAAMDKHELFRKYRDGRLASVEQFQLAAGDSMVLWVPSMGYTWRLEADQPEGNGDNKTASVTMEACTDATSSSVSSGLVNLMPTDDEEAEVSEECLLITDSFDPNDKLVTPVGRTEENYTPTNTALKYKIRFQNTGTDVAYRVVVVDTLSEHLDLSTLQLGAASHTHRFEVSGKGRPVLTWTFDNIMLPDSTADEPGSHGYIQFSIKPKADLPEKTAVENFANIFFDFNSPVRTNVTLNRIYDMPPVVDEAVRVHLEDVLATPSIAAFEPAAGKVGAEVTITGKRFASTPTDNKVYLNGTAATVVSATGSELRILVPAGAATGALKVITPDGGVTASEAFEVYQPPVLNSYSPAEGMVGNIINLHGLHVLPELIEAVKLGDLDCEIVHHQDNTVSVQVPAGAVTGPFSIRTKGGETENITPFTVWYRPAISSLSQESGIVGDTFTITGENFTADKARILVHFGLVKAQVLEASPGHLVVQVPEQADSNVLVVETPGGPAFATFEVIPGPRFSAMQPAKGSVGTVVEISGQHFGVRGLQDKIAFNGQEALVLEASGDRYKVRVPRGATTGKVQITGYGGKAHSSADFVVEDLTLAEAVIISPNPSNGSFTLDLNRADFDVQQLQVYNSLGQLVLEQRVATPRPDMLHVRLPKSQAGIYLVHLHTNHGLFTYKLYVR